MTKKQISDYLTLKKRNNIDNTDNADTLPNIESDYSVYEDITMEDILKFQAILDMLDIAPDEKGILVQSRSSKYIRM